jgi:hypothetical protein
MADALRTSVVGIVRDLTSPDDDLLAEEAELPDQLQAQVQVAPPELEGSPECAGPSSAVAPVTTSASSTTATAAAVLGAKLYVLGDRLRHSRTAHVDARTDGMMRTSGSIEPPIARPLNAGGSDTSGARATASGMRGSLRQSTSMLNVMGSGDAAPAYLRAFASKLSASVPLHSLVWC